VTQLPVTCGAGAGGFGSIQATDPVGRDANRRSRRLVSRDSGVCGDGGCLECVAVAGGINVGEEGGARDGNRRRVKLPGLRS
jgi:hypothetical protein